MANEERKEQSQFRLSFDERKAAAAAAFLLKDAGGRMRYMRLIKLLYLADRESLGRTGRPIVGGRYIAMKYGPVLSEVLDLVRQGGDVWSVLIERDGYEVCLKGDPDVGPLSHVEMDLLVEAAKLYKTIDLWKLSDLTHQLPEWMEKNPGIGAVDITPEDILRALDKSDEEVEQARQDATDRAYFDQLFGT